MSLGTEIWALKHHAERASDDLSNDNLDRLNQQMDLVCKMIAKHNERYIIESDEVYEGTEEELHDKGVCSGPGICPKCQWKLELTEMGSHQGTIGRVGSTSTRIEIRVRGVAPEWATRIAQHLVDSWNQWRAK